MTDPWGTPGGSSPASNGAQRRKTSVSGLVFTVIGVLLIGIFGAVKLFQAPTSMSTPLVDFIPILAVILGFIVLFIGLRLINRARGRRGLS